MSAENSTKKQRGRPFERGMSGNPAGRPLGARNKTTLAAEALLEGEAEALTRKAVELALGGDTTALRLCLERIVAPRRERPVRFQLSELSSGLDAPRAVAAITAAVAKGELTTGEAGDLARLVETFVKTVEIAELERRVAILELTQVNTR